jgi:hypothetical protein
MIKPDSPEARLWAQIAHGIWQERSLAFQAGFRLKGSPLRERSLRIYSGRREQDANPLFLERRLDPRGTVADSIRYSESYLEFCLPGETAGFSEASLAIYRPGRWIESLAFTLDLGLFFVSELDRGKRESREFLFNLPHGFHVCRLSVAAGNLPPIVIVQKKSVNIAWFEKFDMGRTVVGIDIRQYLAAWGAFFNPPLKAGDEFNINFSIEVEPPAGFVQEQASPRKDPPFDPRARALRPLPPDLDELPSTDPETRLRFGYPSPVMLLPDMLP